MIMNELFERYEAEYVPDLLPRTQRDYKGILVYLRATFGQMRPQDIKPSHIRDFLDVKKGRVHRNRMVAILSGVFGAAISDWRVDDEIRNPCFKVKRWPTKPRNRDVADDEFHIFRAICPAQVQLAMDLALLTPLHQNEIVGLTWQQIHMIGAPRDEWAINPPPGVSRGRMPIPITPPLEAVLKRAWTMKPEAPRQYVIRTNPRYGEKGQRYTENGFRALWQRYMRIHEKAGKSRFHFRDLHRRAISEKTIAPAASTRPPLSARMNSKIFWASLIVQDHIPAPVGISPETLADQRRSMDSAGPDGDCIVVYCCVNGCGAIYWMGRRMWSMWAPIGPVEFVTLLEINNVKAKDPREFTEWRKASLDRRRKASTVFPPT